MATHVTEFTRLAREFRVFGVESQAMSVLNVGNVRAGSSFRRSRNVSGITPVLYQSMAFGFILVGVAELTTHFGRNIAASGAVLLLLLRSLTYGSAIQSVSLQLNAFQAFLDGLTDDLERYMAHPRSPNAAALPNEFDVEFKDVVFSYDGSTVALNNVSFSLPEGKMLGVVGRSGSGKSTLAQILIGLRKPEVGAVTLGGQQVSDVIAGSGVSAVALVSQEPVLLQGSIYSNIAFFRDVSRAEVEKASRDAHLHEDILAMPEQYETAVGEGGSSLSGGQRQRLAIARALVGCPKLLVLDEPTSALDGRSESLVRQTLSELRGSVTVVIISHRLAAIEVCDSILVLDSGAIAEFGRSDEVRSTRAFLDIAEAGSGVPVDSP